MTLDTLMVIKESPQPRFPQVASEDDLVVLQYSPNICYTQVLALKNVKHENYVDVMRGLWSFDDWHNVAIGESRSLYLDGSKMKYGIIGVYDRTDISHLDAMVYAAKKFTESEGYWVNAD